tara:strand:+ start:90 stop:881 length:792 start_codon:yes stop_codon:yes gene_type:complete
MRPSVKKYKELVHAAYTPEKRKFNSKYLWWHYTGEKLAIVLATILLRYGISANTVTVISIIFGFIGAVLISFRPEEYFTLGIIFIIFWAILDDTDGHIARTEMTSRLGKFLDDSGANIMYILLYVSVGLVFLRIEDNGSIIISQFLKDQLSTSIFIVLCGFISAILLTLQAVISFHYKVVFESEESDRVINNPKINNRSKMNNYIKDYHGYFVANFLELPGFLIPVIFVSFHLSYLSIIIVLFTLLNFLNCAIKYFLIIRKLR